MSSTSIQSSPSARALQDVRDGWGQRELWGHLGWQDIRQRYRRSLLGPLWITISMAVTAIALGILYAGLFGNSLEEQLPYILVGFIVWGFIAGCINEGSEVFIANVGLITHSRRRSACTCTGWSGARCCSSSTTWPSTR